LEEGEHVAAAVCGFVQAELDEDGAYVCSTVLGQMTRRLQIAWFE
jgi:hypothetical protein